MRHHLPVRALLEDAGRVIGVVTDDGRIDADEVIVAAGPWSPSLLDPIGLRLPISGARGWLVRLDRRRSAAATPRGLRGVGGGDRALGGRRRARGWAR